MNLEELLATPSLVLMKAISGSHAYGTAIEGSDTDIKGVFLFPKHSFYGLSYDAQLADSKNDVVFYELRRFTDLLLKNNPNLLELLETPEDCMLEKHPLMEAYKPALFLSQRCFHTFSGYAMEQIKKARGLNKKIVNPVEKKRKTPLDFCYILDNHRSLPLISWLEDQGWQQKHCGLSSIPHFKNTYALFHDATSTKKYKGIIQKANSNDIGLSSIPKALKADAVLYFNKEGYQTYCKDYRQYWDWVANRNELRYKGTLKHGKNYDAKNMMHTFRLLDMAEEIAKEGRVIVRRPNREFLLAIRSGDFEYDDLLEKAKRKVAGIEQLFKKSKLPLHPPHQQIEQLLIETRTQLYELIP